VTWTELRQAIFTPRNWPYLCSVPVLWGVGAMLIVLVCNTGMPLWASIVMFVPLFVLITFLLAVFFGPLMAEDLRRQRGERKRKPL